MMRSVELIGSEYSYRTYFCKSYKDVQQADLPEIIFLVTFGEQINGAL